MALKTDYKNDVLDTSKNTEKQFRLTQLSGNNYTIEDITAYSQEGDTFNASDINATNTEVNRLARQTNLSVKTSGWVADATFSDYPYKNVISTTLFANVYSQDININSVLKPTNKTNLNTWVENLNKIKEVVLADYATISANSITIYSNEKLTFECTLTIEGV